MARNLTPSPSIAAFALFAALVLGGCATTETFDLPQGQAAYQVIPAQRIAAEQPEYRINPYDELTISVYREPELSVQEAPVESDGGLVLPLIGQIQAAGLTTTEFAAAIEQRLRGYDLLQPRISVIITKSLAQNVTVDGAVQTAGVYDLKGQTTLLQSIALANGATRIAKLDKVAIFRTIDGQRHGGLFDVMAIREGRAPDPYIQAGDYVVVGSSARQSLYYDLIGILPAFGLFVPLVQ